MAAAGRWPGSTGIRCSVVDVRQPGAAGHPDHPRRGRKNGPLFTVEENPRAVRLGAESSRSSPREACFGRSPACGPYTTPHIPLPAPPAWRTRPAVGAADHRNRPRVHGEHRTSNLATLAGMDAPTGLLIGGEFNRGRDGKRLPVIDPATEDVLTEVADGTAEDALDAVAAATGRCRLGRDRAPAARADACAGPSS